jgi:hypothetical protein
LHHHEEHELQGSVDANAANTAVVSFFVELWSRLYIRSWIYRFFYLQRGSWSWSGCQYWCPITRACACWKFPLGIVSLIALWFLAMVFPRVSTFFVGFWSFANI